MPVLMAEAFDLHLVKGAPAGKFGSTEAPGVSAEQLRNSFGLTGIKSAISDVSVGQSGPIGGGDGATY
jgi:hypothetical protein